MTFFALKPIPYSQLPLLLGYRAIIQLMGGHAKSQLAKWFDAWQKYNDLMTHAMAAYKAAKKSPTGSMGYQATCQMISDAYFQETGEHIHLAHVTLQHWVAGGATCSKANDGWKWLMSDEETIIVDYLNKMGDCGFPYSHKQVAEMVNRIISAHLGDAFPESGVGVNWIYCFAI